MRLTNAQSRQYSISESNRCLKLQKLPWYTTTLMEWCSLPDSNWCLLVQGQVRLPLRQRSNDPYGNCTHVYRLKACRDCYYTKESRLQDRFAPSFLSSQLSVLSIKLQKHGPDRIRTCDVHLVDPDVSAEFLSSTLKFHPWKDFASKSGAFSRALPRGRKMFRSAVALATRVMVINWVHF